MKIIVAFVVLATALISWSQINTSKPIDTSSKSVATPTSIPDLWIGTYNVDQLPGAGDMPYNFVLKPDGTLTTDGFGADGNRYYSDGIWKLDGDTVRCVYKTINYYAGPEVIQSAKFYYNKETSTLSSGTWKDEENGSEYTGRFPEMKRVNKLAQ